MGLGLFGWIDVARNQGKMAFFDFRDTTGKVQGVVFGKPEVLEVAKTLRPEWVVAVTGIVNERPEKMVKEGKAPFDWLTDSYTIGPFFKLNPVASELYLSDKPEGTFNKIYDTSFTIGDSAWPLVVKEGAYVYVGGKEVSVYVYVVKKFLEKSGTTRILARGAKIPKAHDVANIVCNDPKYELVDTIGSSSRNIAENGQPATISSITIVMRKKQT